jgi:hypothetical protein
VDAIAIRAGFTVYLSGGDVVMRLQRRGEPARMLRSTLRGANRAPEVVPEKELPGVSNYLLGSDPTRWRTGVRQYARIRYKAIYPGVDLVFYGNQGQIEYDFELMPGANPNVIRLGFQGADDVRLDSNGDLVLRIGGREVRQRRPVLYQDIGTARIPVDGGYVLTRRGARFAVGAYDRTAPLVIDPTIVYSTFLGGTGYDYLWGLESDKSGAVYVLGATTSFDFPVRNALQPTRPSADPAEFDTVLAKINPAGTALEYSTYLAGVPRALAIGPGGEPFVVRRATNDNPPTAPGYRYGCTCDGISVAKLNRQATAYVYDARIGARISTYTIPGVDIAVDRSGNAIVSGTVAVDASSGFPVVNAAQPTAGGSDDAFALKLDAAGTGLIYSTFLGGEAHDASFAIAIGPDDSVAIAGFTDSERFPVVNAVQPSMRPGFSHEDAFVTKLSTHGALVFSTYLGGSSGDAAYGVAQDPSGFVYVSGQTFSIDFPVASAFMSHSDGASAFVTKLTPTGSSVVYSTYLGGSRGNDDFALGVVADRTGSATVTGATTSPDFPVRFPLQAQRGRYDVFVTRFGPSGSLRQSTYFGSGAEGISPRIALGLAGTVYVGGETHGTDFPIRNSLQPLLTGGDLFVARLKMGIAIPDFDGDDWLDLVFQNQADGRLETWAMNGVTRQGVVALTPSQVADTGWKIVGTGDFDADGQLDVAWQHADGRVAVWFMNGTTERSGTLLDPPQVDDLQWRIRAVADINADGRADLIWQHTGDGRVAVWFMDGSRLISGTLLTPGQVDDLGWEIVGAGDFNSDDEWDLVWQHTDGRIAVWLMHGTSLVDGSLISPPQVMDTTWRLHGVGDINGDGHPDLIWQNEADGRVAAWLMNGLTLVDGVLLTPNAVSDLNWKIVGPR